MNYSYNGGFEELGLRGIFIGPVIFSSLMGALFIGVPLGLIALFATRIVLTKADRDIEVRDLSIRSLNPIRKLIDHGWVSREYLKTRPAEILDPKGAAQLIDVALTASFPSGSGETSEWCDDIRSIWKQFVKANNNQWIEGSEGVPLDMQALTNLIGSKPKDDSSQGVKASWEVRLESEKAKLHAATKASLGMVVSRIDNEAGTANRQKWIDETNLRVRNSKGFVTVHSVTERFKTSQRWALENQPVNTD